MKKTICWFIPATLAALLLLSGCGTAGAAVGHQQDKAEKRQEAATGSS